MTNRRRYASEILRRASSNYTGRILLADGKESETMGRASRDTHGAMVPVLRRYYSKGGNEHSRSTDQLADRGCDVISRRGMLDHLL